MRIAVISETKSTTLGAAENKTESFRAGNYVCRFWTITVTNTGDTNDITDVKFFKIGTKTPVEDTSMNIDTIAHGASVQKVISNVALTGLDVFVESVDGTSYEVEVLAV